MNPTPPNVRIKKRRTIGLVLVGASVLTAAAIQLLTGAVVQARTVREDAYQSGRYVVDFSATELKFNRRYAIPLAACFLAGVVCLAWPARKPPRLAP